MDVGCFVNSFPRSIHSHAFHQRKRAVDRGQLGVSSNQGAVRESLELVLDLEIGVVPVIKDVSVFHKELRSGLGLVLPVRRKREPRLKIDPLVIRFLEIARCLEHVGLFTQKKLVSQDSVQLQHCVRTWQTFLLGAAFLQ